MKKKNNKINEIVIPSVVGLLAIGLVGGVVASISNNVDEDIIIKEPSLPINDNSTHAVDLVDESNCIVWEWYSETRKESTIIGSADLESIYNGYSSSIKNVNSHMAINDDFIYEDWTNSGSGGQRIDFEFGCSDYPFGNEITYNIYLRLAFLDELESIATFNEEDNCYVLNNLFFWMGSDIEYETGHKDDYTFDLESKLKITSYNCSNSSYCFNEIFVGSFSFRINDSEDKPIASLLYTLEGMDGYLFDAVIFEPVLTSTAKTSYFEDDNNSIKMDDIEETPGINWGALTK